MSLSIFWGAVFFLMLINFVTQLFKLLVYTDGASVSNLPADRRDWCILLKDFL